MKFRPKLWSIILFVVAAGLFLRLGIWQLDRAKQKASLISTQEKNGQVQRALTKTQLVQPYQKLVVEGAFDNRHPMLLDNQFYRHQVGFDVLTPFQTREGKWLLVDRGWVQAGRSRQQLPKVSYASQSRIVGRAYFPSAKEWFFGDAFENKGQWPLVVEHVDFAKLHQLLDGRSFFPFILRLERTQKDAFPREWPVVVMKPARHRAYAFQWFMMALAVFVVFIRMNLVRK